ncbi:uncharacterized protein DNG_04067 [Cephalotrichum gorgonifer]|uniref:Uncharacterized protein n=1 Tax=Cephalotrichum gorgonifer TaxID=2041049 RepID=A0AAE8SU66_9PEZI|nr:uncharacterized protein DNG_04067 [Cephalotrichum gorgonifer]
MSRISSSLVALTVLASQVAAAPQAILFPLQCQKPNSEYQITQVSDPYYLDAQPVGGASCVAGAMGECQHGNTFQHAVGVSQSVAGGLGNVLDLGRILGLEMSLGYEKSWSTEDAVATSTTIVCPEPKEGTSYVCGLQVKPKVIKTNGKVHTTYSDQCPGYKDPGFVDFEVVAPHISTGGANAAANAEATFSACVLSCPDDPNSVNCDGAKSALDDLKLPLCPHASPAVKSGFSEGWCTAHIVQHQRWQGVVGDRFKFSLQIFDGKGKSIYNKLYQEVNEQNVLSVWTVLPYSIEIQAGNNDKDFVNICYAGQCFSCDDNDGGAHGCTLGNGKEYGYEDNERKGDFGFSCMYKK